MLLSDGKITHIGGGQSVTEGSVFPLFRPSSSLSRGETLGVALVAGEHS